MPSPSQNTPLKWYQRKAVKWGLGALILIAIALFALNAYITSRTQPRPNITDSPTTLIGFNHVGISVMDLDKMLNFYQRTTSFELLKRESVSENEAADKLFGQEGISFERAILKAPNMLLEITEFDNQTDSLIENMPPQGPGMTHTCYQSAMANSGYAHFKQGGIDMLTRGDTAIHLGNYGVSYAYGYDPEGNMLEMEQMSDNVISLAIGSDWAEENPLWMTQVAIL
ncbi:MAG: VOC family protein, partial [Bacteroidota bacterium]